MYSTMLGGAGRLVTSISAPSGGNKPPRAYAPPKLVMLMGPDAATSRSLYDHPSGTWTRAPLASTQAPEAVRVWGSSGADCRNNTAATATMEHQACFIMAFILPPLSISCFSAPASRRGPAQLERVLDANKRLNER